MMDAYAHLDVTASNPLSDFKARMASAGIDRALIVEIWKGDNYSYLHSLVAATSPQFGVVPCFRPAVGLPAIDLLEHDIVVGVRAKTADLNRLGDLAAFLESSGMWLVPHAEQGIGFLAAELINLVGRYPQLRVYLPHCAWPRRDKQDDKDWARSITSLSRLPNLVVGISAIAHFSRATFPHNDIQPFVTRLIRAFGPDSVAVGSDYPMLEKTLYSDYMNLAQEWIRQEYPRWSPRFESLIFG
jgi:hypothetical protein